MAQVNELLIQSDRFRNELESLVRNGDPNILTGAKVRHDIEERLGLQKDSLREQPWKTMVSKALDEVLIMIQEEQEAKRKAAKSNKKNAVKSDHEDEDKSATENSAEQQVAVKSEEKSNHSALKLESSDEEVAEDPAVKKPLPKKKHVSKEKNPTPAKIPKAKVKKEKSPPKDKDSSDGETATKKPKGRKKPEDKKKNSPSEEKIERLKTYIRKCGVRKKWVAEFEGLTTQGQKIKKLESILKDLGVEGQPSLKKCEQVKQERELKADIAGLDTENILVDEGNGRRSTRRSQPAKRKRHIAASDDEDDEDEERNSSTKVAKTSSPGLDLSFLGDQSSDSD
ncbi:hypothetical protein BJV82DRAFT_620416 [Fennellomyces sp. T-0311]|nr:hypothetical protein BJV82DRAFT_620416 [Fennellomyces sp. T-0311]